MRPVGTTSCCQSGPQGPVLRHRVSVSTPWVSSSRSSATSAVRGPEAAQAPGFPQAHGCARPSTSAHPGGALPSLHPTWSWGTGRAPPEAVWYQRLSSQVGAASCRTGERRAAAAVSLPRCVPTAAYQPGQPRGQEMAREARRAADCVEPRPSLTEVGAQSVVCARPRPLRRRARAVSEPAVARSADVPPATGVLLEVAGEGGARAGRDPVVTCEDRGSGGAAARAGPAAAPWPRLTALRLVGAAPAVTHEVAHGLAGGPAVGGHPGPAGAPCCQQRQPGGPGWGGLLFRSPETPQSWASWDIWRPGQEVVQGGGQKPMENCPRGPLSGPGGQVWPWRGWLSGWSAWVCKGLRIPDVGSSPGRKTEVQHYSRGAAAGWARPPQAPPRWRVAG